MAWCDDVLGLDPETPPGRAQWEAAQARIADLPVEDLVQAWREVAHSGPLDRTPGTDLFHTSFDALGHDAPERAVAFLEEAARAEEDDEVLALIGEDKLLLQLLHFNADRVIDALEAACARTPRLRWLLGSVAWAFEGAVADRDVSRRLTALADADAYRAWRADLTAHADRLDFAALDTAALADAWIRINSWSALLRARDEMASDLLDHQAMLVEETPERALALAAEIARRTDDHRLIGLLGASLLEDLLPAEEGPLLDAIEREAKASETFRIALCGAYLSGWGRRWRRGSTACAAARRISAPERSPRRADRGRLHRCALYSPRGAGDHGEGRAAWQTSAFTEHGRACATRARRCMASARASSASPFRPPASPAAR